MTPKSGGVQARSRPAAKKQAAQKQNQAGQKRSTPKRRETPAKRLPQPAQPRGVPTSSSRHPAQAPQGAEKRPPTPVLGIAVQAATELAEIGLTLSARAVRRAISRFPRP